MLKQCFYELAQLFSPAYYVQDAITLAGANSAKLNKGYQTLLSPLKRAEYLLSLQGITVEETEKLDGETENHAEFIMEVMEARTALEEADSEEGITHVRQENKCALYLVPAASQLKGRFVLQCGYKRKSRRWRVLSRQTI